MRWFLLSAALFIVLIGAAVVMADPLAGERPDGTGGSSPTVTAQSSPSATPGGTEATPSPTGEPGASGSPTPTATAEPSPGPTPVIVEVDLLPDLVTLQPSELRVSIEEGRRLLRFNNDIGNTGLGVLELSPGPAGDSLCGDEFTPRRLVYQRIYRDTTGLGYYSRNTTTEFSQRSVGCMLFHPEHSHWHFEDFTLFELVDPSGNSVRGNKNSTCMMDSHRNFNVPGSPLNAHYLYESCSQDTPQGISTGWVDRYGWDLPDQFVDITDVPDGLYCLVSRADPEGHISETDTSNNVASIRLELQGDAVITHPGQPCAGDNPPPLGAAPDPAPAEVFNDTLYWRDWSWETSINVESTQQVYEGRWSLGVTMNVPWADLALWGRDFNTTGYSSIRFYINTDGQPWPDLLVGVSDVAENPLAAVKLWNYAETAGNGWYMVEVPLRDLRAENMVISTLEISDDAGIPHPAFYLDGIEFVPAQGQ